LPTFKLNLSKLFLSFFT